MTVLAILLALAVGGWPAPASSGRITRVLIEGYAGMAMDPAVTADGRYLLFNDTNVRGADTNLHVAERTGHLVYAYRGLVAGANSAAVDAMASFDREGRMYFVSTRSYAGTMSTVFRAFFDGRRAEAVHLVPGVAAKAPAHVVFDATISLDGSTLVLSEGPFTPIGLPATSDLVFAKRSGDGFARDPDGWRVLSLVNTPALEFAGALSPDGLTLAFTRVPTIAGVPEPAIYLSRRNTVAGGMGGIASAASGPPS